MEAYAARFNINTGQYASIVTMIVLEERPCPY